MTNRIELEVAAEERLFDAMLDEVGHEVAGLGAVPRSLRWLAAALVLLGIVVVFGVVVSSRRVPNVAVTPQEPASPPLPPIVKVRGLAELQKIDRSAENLWCEFERPEEIAALKDFPRLRGVRIVQVLMGGDVTVDPAWSLESVAECSKLEWVSVRYFGRGRQVGGPVLPFAAADLAPLVRLPVLRSLDLAGAEKVLDADLAAVLHKLSLRSLVLQAVHCTPEGLRSLGELPLLERLELRDCSGLEQCDLRHLFRLRQLQALTLRGLGGGRAALMDRSRVGGLGAVLDKSNQKEPAQLVTAAWMRELATALPGLRELDLAESRIDDAVLAALPRQLSFLGLSRSFGFGEAGFAAVVALPGLRGFAFSEVTDHRTRSVTVSLPLLSTVLQQRQLERIEFTGVPTQAFLDLLRGQVGLRELALALPAEITVTGMPGQTGTGFDLNLDFAALADLPHLQRVELVGRPSQALEKAARRAAGDRVRVDVLPR